MSHRDTEYLSDPRQQNHSIGPHFGYIHAGQVWIEGPLGGMHIFTRDTPWHPATIIYNAVNNPWDKLLSIAVLLLALAGVLAFALHP